MLDFANFMRVFHNLNFDLSKVKFRSDFVERFRADCLDDWNEKESASNWNVDRLDTRSEFDEFKVIGKANDLWADYIATFIAVNNKKQPYIFRTHLKYIAKNYDVLKDQGYEKIALDVALELSRDKKFKAFSIDALRDYLEQTGSDDSVIDAAELIFLWYKTGKPEFDENGCLVQ